MKGPEEEAGAARGEPRGGAAGGFRLAWFQVRLARVLTSRYALVAINVLLFLVSVYTMSQAFALVVDDVDNVPGIDHLLNGLGTIFIAHGCALEGRKTLMNVLGLYPKYHSEQEETVDRICDTYGLLLVVGGLFMEVSAELVQIPAHLLNLKDIETGVFGVGFLSWVIIVWLLVRFVWALLVCDPDFPGRAEAKAVKAVKAER